MTGYPQIGFNPYNMYQNWGYGYQYPAFRGVQNVPQPVGVPQPNVNLQTPPDTVSFRATEHIQAKSKKEGLSTGAKWGLGALALAGIGTAVYFATRGKVGAKQAQQLAEHIEFKPAKTAEEAKKFAQEKLGVHYNDIDDVEIVNFVNEWLTGVYNGSKIKDFKAYPKFVSTDYNEIADNALFGMIDEVVKHNGQEGYLLTININNLKNISNLLMKIKTNPYGVWQIGSSGQICLKGERFNTKEVQKLVTRLNNYNSSNASLKESMELYNQIRGLLTSPVGSDGKVVLKKLSAFNSLNHELGHMKHYINGVAPADMDKIAVYQRLNKDIPELVKNFHKPEVKEQIAGKVSSYAKESPLEFVAETYAQMKDGVVFSDDVMALYKKYGGPALT